MLKHHKPAPAGREPRDRVTRGAEPEFDPGSVARVYRDRIVFVRQPLFGDQLGRLFGGGKISQAELAAGEKWRELADLYARARGAPKKHPSQSIEPGAKSRSPDPDSPEGVREAARDRRRIVRYELALDALRTCEHAKAAEAAVVGVCENETAPVGHAGLFDLIRGLARLAKHFADEARVKRRR